MREIQSGGGSTSFDPAVAHFELGAANQVARVEICWSTSETDIVEGPFNAGALYRITPYEMTAGSGAVAGQRTNLSFAEVSLQACLANTEELQELVLVAPTYTNH